MGKILAVTNQKGGVGKTTTALNLAAGLALADRTVLLVDVDPQANLTSGVGLKGHTAKPGTLYEAITAAEEVESLEPFVIPTKLNGLSLIPADRNLTGAEIELVGLPDREHRLRNMLRPLRDRFDYIVIDCPPSLGLMTLNALVAADAVLIPLHCEYFALEGLAELVSTLRRVRAALNRDLDIAGVLLTMYDERTNLGQQVARDVRAFFQDKVFKTVIPRNVRLGEAPSHGVPGVIYDPKSRGAEAYLSLARELLLRDAKAGGKGDGSARKRDGKPDGKDDGKTANAKADARTDGAVSTSDAKTGGDGDGKAEGDEGAASTLTTDESVAVRSDSKADGDEAGTSDGKTAATAEPS